MSSASTERQLQMWVRALSAGLNGRGISVLHQRRDHTYDLAENLPEEWTGRDVVGYREADFLALPLARQIITAFDACLSSGQSQRVGFELSDPIRRKQFQAQLLPDADGVTTIVTDVTEERGREAAVNELLREVSHRSKNLLAIVQSVAMQTARHSTSIQQFLDRFRGRLHALSSTQDLVTESNWRGTHLQSLVTSQLARIGPLALGKTRMTGENPVLGPNAALHIGLAIHELAANAALHGALAHIGAGHIWIDAKLSPDDRQLVIEWQETGIEHAKGREPARFGTMVLEHVVPLSVGGEALFTVDAGHVSYRLSVPTDQFAV